MLLRWKEVPCYGVVKLLGMATVVSLVAMTARYIVGEYVTQQCMVQAQLSTLTVAMKKLMGPGEGPTFAISFSVFFDFL